MTMRERFRILKGPMAREVTLLPGEQVLLGFTTSEPDQLVATILLDRRQAEDLAEQLAAVLARMEGK